MGSVWARLAQGAGSGFVLLDGVGDVLPLCTRLCGVCQLGVITFGPRLAETHSLPAPSPPSQLSVIRWFAAIVIQVFINIECNQVTLYTDCPNITSYIYTHAHAHAPHTHCAVIDTISHVPRGMSPDVWGSSSGRGHTILSPSIARHTCMHTEKLNPPFHGH